MDFKEQLKSSVDIVKVIGEYVRLRKTGVSRYTGLCPFHNEKTPSSRCTPATSSTSASDAAPRATC